MLSPIYRIRVIEYRLVTLTKRADSLGLRQRCTPGRRRSWFARWLMLQRRRFMRWLLKPIPFPMQIPPRGVQREKQKSDSP